MSEDAPVPVSPRDSRGNVTRLERDGKEIFLIGTAHVSRHSVEEVGRVIDELRPDVVCVELDQARYETLTDETRWRRLNVSDIVRGNRAGLFLSGLVFAGFQKRLGDRLGVKPGTEMLAAVEAANRVGAAVVLADRDIQATLMRCYRRLGFVNRAKVLGILGMLPFAAPDIDEAQVERLKSREAMDDVMTTFAREMPDLQVPLITERDRYLMASAEQATGKRVVAVVGAAHVPGMVRHLGERAERTELSKIPGPSLRERLVRWVPLALALLLASLLYRRTGSLSHMPVLIGSLVGGPAAGALVLALACGADFAVALLAAVLAPVSFFAPPLPLGRITALMQAGRVPVVPDDASRIRDDILSPRTARRNAFIRVLLAAVAPGFGRTLGGAIAFIWAFARLAFTR